MHFPWRSCVALLLFIAANSHAAPVDSSIMEPPFMEKNRTLIGGLFIGGTAGSVAWNTAVVLRGRRQLVPGVVGFAFAVSNLVLMPAYTFDVGDGSERLGWGMSLAHGAAAMASTGASLANIAIAPSSGHVQLQLVVAGDRRVALEGRW